MGLARLQRVQTWRPQLRCSLERAVGGCAAPYRPITGIQLVLSPVSVWSALLLLLNGAGEGSAQHCGTDREQTASERWADHESIHAVCALKCAGPSTPTYNELWGVVAGNATQFTGDSTPLAALNIQVAALRDALARQASGGTVNLTIADALWTTGVSLNPSYAGDMQRLFKVNAADAAVGKPNIPRD